MTTDLMDFIRNAQDKHRASIAALKPAVFSSLKNAGITKVTVLFDGDGDSGQTEYPVAYDEKGIVALPDGKLKDQIETLCYDCLEAEHGGWEINDGSYGEFEFDVAETTIKLDCNVRYVDSNNFTHEF